MDDLVENQASSVAVRTQSALAEEVQVARNVFLSSPAGLNTPEVRNLHDEPTARAEQSPTGLKSASWIVEVFEYCPSRYGGEATWV
jgi:hypothetical protein